MANGNGWLKISRKIMSSWVWQNDRHFKWWMHILLSAAWEDTDVCVNSVQVHLERGQFAYTARGLAKEWNCDRGMVMRFFKSLEADGMITTQNAPVDAPASAPADAPVRTTPNDGKSFLHINIVSICNYETYQGEGGQIKNDDEKSECASGCASRCATKRATIYKEDKEEENNTSTIVDILQKKIFCFKNMVEPFRLQYGSDMVDDFIAYWTEPTKSGKLIRFDLERTWDTKRRLGTWERNNRNKYGNANNRTSTGDGAAQRAADAARLVNELLEQ